MKISKLQLTLTVLFVSCLLISNIIVSKQVLLPFNITMVGAVIIFPITYILSDVFSEVYGYKWSRFTCYLGFFMNLLAVTVFYIVQRMPYPEYWQHQQAYETVLGSTPKILFASFLAFIVGDYVNDNVFKKMKAKYQDTHKRFGIRAIISSLCGELVDSSIFLPIALWGVMPISEIIKLGIFQVSIKVSYEILILPLTTFIVKKVSKYEKNN